MSTHAGKINHFHSPVVERGHRVISQGSESLSTASVRRCGADEIAHGETQLQVRWKVAGPSSPSDQSSDEETLPIVMAVRKTEQIRRSSLYGGMFRNRQRPKSFLLCIPRCRYEQSKATWSLPGQTSQNMTLAESEVWSLSTCEVTDCYRGRI